MSDFNFLISQTINSFNQDYRRMISIRITKATGKFPIRSVPEFVRVRSGGNTVDAFMTGFSGDQKELTGFFTTDAFVGFPANADVEFGFGDKVMDRLENIDINASIVQLPALLASVAAPDADNAWLQSIS